MHRRGIASSDAKPGARQDRHLAGPFPCRCMGNIDWDRTVIVGSGTSAVDRADPATGQGARCALHKKGRRQVLRRGRLCIMPRKALLTPSGPVHPKAFRPTRRRIRRPFVVHENLEIFLSLLQSQNHLARIFLWISAETIHRLRHVGRCHCAAWRGERMTANSVVHWFQRLYDALGFVGCSSHSGRRTFCQTIKII